MEYPAYAIPGRDSVRVTCKAELSFIGSNQASNRQQDSVMHALSMLTCKAVSSLVQNYRSRIDTTDHSLVGAFPPFILGAIQASRAFFPLSVRLFYVQSSPCRSASVLHLYRGVILEAQQQYLQGFKKCAREDSMSSEQFEDQYRHACARGKQSSPPDW